jgi:predicted N-acetyltransferase YhbS
MEIREFRKTDAAVVSALIIECFNTIDLGGHTEEGKRIQIESNSPGKLLRRAKSTRYFVAVKDEQVVGICGYDKHRVQTLFVDIRYLHKGIGKALLNKILSEAVNEGLSGLKTWATLYSEQFYSESGFRKIGEIHGPEGRNDIILMEMECDLSKLCY